MPLSTREMLAVFPADKSIFSTSSTVYPCLNSPRILFSPLASPIDMPLTTLGVSHQSMLTHIVPVTLRGD